MAKTFIGRLRKEDDDGKNEIGGNLSGELGLKWVVDLKEENNNLLSIELGRVLLVVK